MRSLFDPELMRGDYVAQIVGYYDRASMRATTPPMHAHSHAHIEVMYATAGRTSIRLRGGVYPLRAGDMILLDAHVPHQLIISPDEDFSMMNVEFLMRPAPGEGGSLRTLAGRNQSLRALLSRPAPWLIVRDCDDAVKHVMKQSVALCDSTHPQARELCSLLMSMLLLLVAHCASEADQPARGETQDPHVGRALALLRSQDLAEPLSVEALARQVGVSRTHLERLFRSALGTTPAACVRRARVERARELLDLTELPERRIAQLVGYADAAHFARVYERETGERFARGT